MLADDDFDGRQVFSEALPEILKKLPLLLLTELPKKACKYYLQAFYL